ncbi:MAG: hypothetical protein QXW10_04650, partial [Candidatus Micrarchaeaceae archaeon]
ALVRPADERLVEKEAAILVAVIIVGMHHMTALREKRQRRTTAPFLLKYLDGATVPVATVHQLEEVMVICHRLPNASLLLESTQPAIPFICCRQLQIALHDAVPVEQKTAVVCMSVRNAIKESQRTMFFVRSADYATSRRKFIRQLFPFFSLSFFFSLHRAYFASFARRCMRPIITSLSPHLSTLVFC